VSEAGSGGGTCDVCGVCDVCDECDVCGAARVCVWDAAALVRRPQQTHTHTRCQRQALVPSSHIYTHTHTAYETPAVGRDGAVRPFRKPWCLVLLMFVGE
jgi:hypothetical protein